LQARVIFALGAAQAPLGCLHGDAPSLGCQSALSPGESGLNFVPADFVPLAVLYTLKSLWSEMNEGTCQALPDVGACWIYMQDDCVFKMIIDLASQDTGIGARALAQAIEAQDADPEQQEGAAAAQAGRQRRTSSRAREVPVVTPKSRRKRISGRTSNSHDNKS